MIIQHPSDTVPFSGTRDCRHRRIRPPRERKIQGRLAQGWVGQHHRHVPQPPGIRVARPHGALPHWMSIG